MIVRKLSILVMLILIIMTSTVFANIPDSMDVETAKARSQETLLINSIEGTPYYVFIISDNAKYVSNVGPPSYIHHLTISGIIGI